MASKTAKADLYENAITLGDEVFLLVEDEPSYQERQLRARVAFLEQQLQLHQHYLAPLQQQIARLTLGVSRTVKGIALPAKAVMHPRSWKSLIRDLGYLLFHPLASFGGFGRIDFGRCSNCGASPELND